LVFSDIDDTLKPGAKKDDCQVESVVSIACAAGVDTSYTAAHTIYPGMGKFLYELNYAINRPPAYNGYEQVYFAPEDVPLTNFLSARPYVLSHGGSESLQEKIVSKSGVENWGKHKSWVNEYGHVADTSFYTSTSYKNYGNTKYNNIKSFVQKSEADFGFFFVCDDGQGDVLAANKLLSEPETNLLGAFIHHVSTRPHFNADEDDRLIYYENVVQLIHNPKFKKLVKLSPGTERAITNAFLQEMAEIIKSGKFTSSEASTNDWTAFDEAGGCLKYQEMLNIPDDRVDGCWGWINEQAHYHLADAY